jgi:hypothetical protein
VRSFGAATRATVHLVEPRTYRIEVEGELGPRYAAAFEGMELEAEGGTTAIVGPIEDQAQLKGLLDAVAALGLSLVSVTPMEPRAV